MGCPALSGTEDSGPIDAADPLSHLSSWDSDWSGLRVVVAGIGKTGFSIADTLIELGARVVVVAAAEDAEAQQAADTLRIVGAIEVLLGEQVSQQLPEVEGQRAQLVVTSPGLRPSHPLLSEAANAGIPVWGDIELAWRVRERAGRKTADWITITGTNGKTTTTTMVESMLQAAGLRAIAVGNIGTPILDAIREPEGYDAFAVELSSFQLHWTYSVSPVSSVCLNLAEDHVDWHGSFAAYAADKAKVYQNTQRACIYNAEQLETEHMVEEAEVIEGCRAVAFTTGMPAISMLGIVEGLLVDRAFIAERRDSAAELAQLADIGELVPRHQVANALAAAALVRAYGVAASAVRDGLRNYDNGAHRIQPVAQRDGVLWVNDSKATNPHAAAASLAAFNPVIWIAGGDAKGTSYDELVKQHSARLKTVILLGEDSSALRAALARHAPNVPVIEPDSGETGMVQQLAAVDNAQPIFPGPVLMARAVRAAAGVIADGDTVLLAPAAASIDQFSSYAQRGEAFIAAVTELLEGQATTRTSGTEGQ
ncbi:UDP-N-acetylmuramoyl-L-alanine--D-glutamate ligase [Psychromicrobium lacuslunae]|uniref:UDP-N-acetylmuramoylalanine--D-glutamate ligase n=1 Tax=Psychromicrobium lacuslunae TaxID=1618207 RepID=A0A0D4BX76_9MICC|nr:UDP-N-acetylmuramoyl-L-alanine--D-glutamate ligase [Psychromicrobium lacuslunae]AJT40716.1 UDP-N-acetylmuramoyl-L-alanyl-D-glutamate synthetase [Psychromicrobium lacuslunae]